MENRNERFEITLNGLISADLTELIGMSSRTLPAELELYRRVLIAYLTGDNDHLRELLHSAKEIGYIHVITQARLKHNLRELNSAELQTLDHRVAQELSKYVDLSPRVRAIWMAEAVFIQANGFGNLADHRNAELYFSRAARDLEAAGAIHKSVRAQLNSILSANNQETHRRYLPHMHALYRRAKKVGDKFTAALCLENISREYQLLGALEASLKFARAAAIGFRDNYGHINFYQSILHLADVLAEIGRVQEARSQIEICKSAPFAEIQSAIVVLESRLGINTGKRALYRDMNVSWQERMEQVDEKPEIKGERLAPVEGRLIQILSVKAHTTKEIAFALYPDEPNMDMSIGRVKALLARVRKKRPNQIVYANGKYELADADTYRFSIQMAGRQIVS